MQLTVLQKRILSAMSNEERVKTLALWKKQSIDDAKELVASVKKGERLNETATGKRMGSDYAGIHELKCRRGNLHKMKHEPKVAPKPKRFSKH